MTPTPTKLVAIFAGSLALMAVAVVMIAGNELRRLGFYFEG